MMFTGRNPVDCKKSYISVSTGPVPAVCITQGFLGKRGKISSVSKHTSDTLYSAVRIDKQSVCDNGPEILRPGTMEQMINPMTFR